jgi:endoglucanase
MKKKFLLFLIILLAGKMEFAVAQTPFNHGVNLTGWLQTSGTRQIQFSKYTKKDFQNIKSLGCDVIRLPINLFYMTSGSPDYTVDPLFFQFLDQVVNWAEELQLYLIIDNHTSDDLASKNPNLQTVLTKVWSQMATHYKDRSTYILYEILNEPNGSITTAAWGGIQQAAINSIRAVDGKHTIVVGGASYNSYTELSSLPVYTDTNLLYTFHFYDPFVFTHQGATWPVPSMGSLAGVPFPYNAATMPSVPADLVGTWVAGGLSNYINDGTVAKVRSLIDIAVAFKTARNVNLFCGEFGVYNLNSPDNDRTYWYGQVRSYLESKGIAWTTWDYQGGFGLFKKGSNEQFNYDLNTPLVSTLGLTVPPQQVYILKPDSLGFNIYSDFIGENIIESSNASGGTIDFYSNSKPNNGAYCLYWNGCTQYGTVGFNFAPDKDLSTLRAQNYALSLLVRGNSTGTSFDLRFTDTKTGSTDHPWRMNYTLDQTKVSWDSKWHKIFIPLTSFWEGGSWDNGSWYNASGLFDWKAVDRFDIVAEQGSLTGKSFWFDNIQISNMDTAKIYETSTFADVKEVNVDTPAFKIYPNPFSVSVTISYVLSKTETIDISIYNLAGQKIKTIVNANQSGGNYSVKWNRDQQISQGVYFCRLASSTVMNEMKIIVI